MNISDVSMDVTLDTVAVEDELLEAEPELSFVGLYDESPSVFFSAAAEASVELVVTPRELSFAVEPELCALQPVISIADMRAADIVLIYLYLIILCLLSERVY